MFGRPLSCFQVTSLFSSTSPRLRRFTVLALESSADDSCAAVVTSDRRVLSNIVVKQTAEVEKYGGIHPYIAIQSHQKNLPGAVRRAFEDAGLSVNDIDGIAFTRGPGMGGCLSVASNAAKTLAAALNKPLIGVHHMQAHALTALLTSSKDDMPHFPFLTLLVSGGHTMLVLARSVNNFETLCNTVDISIGNVYDKVFRLLALPPHPDQLGPGAALERFCNENSSIDLTIPQFAIASPGQRQFSYAGLLSAVQYEINRRLGNHDSGPGELSHEDKVAIARGFQNAAAAQLEEKLGLVLDVCIRRGLLVKHLVMSGGVASNEYVRNTLRTFLQTSAREEARDVTLCCPPAQLCTDNAVMIAWASMHRFLNHDHDDYTIDLRPTWSIEEAR
ncbi:glycoprotease [Sistotremastrum niveocremeum HHB9708]|uniref:N(6)-L-threonylcarbamoyladenine synthase n=1 Tax=Sistotremastrum niveocremeum HHB9708 TaxID=1314777 RepID=A0A165A1J2_9AGAM|nr:glycoprotease [Sistotremastrum niveocremeum HHB9708]